MTTAELLYQKVKALPKPLQYQALDYIDDMNDSIANAFANWQG